ncbi:flagellar assembly protein A [Paenibacillus sp. FSL H7-0756]|uniref:flagellar assembly protein A n=2 Tax=unclassified Paenibacillus TaxID=185978 RepID=UPI0030FA3023
MIIRKSEVTTMPQQDIEPSRYEFVESLMLERKGLLDSFSVEGRTSDGTTGDKNGIILVQDNQIFITPPLPGGAPARISAIHPVVLKINWKTVTEPTEVTKSDYITWEICEKPQYEITVSPDKLKVHFTLYRAEKYAWNLVNCPAAFEAVVRAQPNPAVLLSTLTIEQIISSLDNRFILRSLNIPALYAELENPTYLPVCIAEGRAPLPGKEARLEFLLPEHTLEGNRMLGGQESPAQKPAEPLEYLRFPGAPFTFAGEVFARKLPPEEGIPGLDTDGRVLPPPPPQDIYFAAGNHAKLLPCGNIVANHTGRPRICGGSGSIRICDFPPLCLLTREMTEPAGDVMFAGDIIVPGDLEGSVRIEALGNVYVYGDIRQSTIIATGSIYVSGQVTGSGLYAGYAGVQQHRLHSLAGLLRIEVDGLREAARQLAKNVESRQQSVNYGLVVMLLLEDKYNHLDSLIRDLEATLSRMNGEFGSGTDPLRHMLEVFTHPGQFTGYITDSVLSSFSRLLLKLGEEIELLEEEHAVINLARSQGSRLESGGKLLVRDSC